MGKRYCAGSFVSLERNDKLYFDNHSPFWLNTPINLSRTNGIGKRSAGIALLIGYDLFLPVCPPGECTGVRRWLTSGTSSRMLLESVYRLASSITNLVIAMPLEGPRYRGVSSLSSNRTRPPGRIDSSVSCSVPSSSIYRPSSSCRARTRSCSLIT